MRGRSASNATRSKLRSSPWLELVPSSTARKSGLVKRIGAAWTCRSSAALVNVPGHVLEYSGPSKSASVEVQPVRFTSVDCAPVKQPRSSSAPESVASRSCTPSTVQRRLAGLTALQYSKWPISSENATLYECAAHGTRVCSLEVAYSGWKAAGMFWHVVPFGSHFTWPN